MLKTKKLLFVVWTILASFLLACGSEKKNLTPENFVMVDKIELAQNGNTYDQGLSHLNLQSNTRLQASSLLLNYRDPLTFNLKGQFVSDQAKLVLNAYTTSLTIADGTRLEFTPNNSNGIEVHLFTRDYPLYHFCTIDYAVSKNGMIDLSVQLSSSNFSGPSIVIWNMYYDGKNKRKKSYTFLNSQSADCNSQDEIFIEHFGSGRLWGFEIRQTRIQEVVRSEAYEL